MMPKPRARLPEAFRVPGYDPVYRVERFSNFNGVRYVKGRAIDDPFDVIETATLDVVWVGA